MVDKVGIDQKRRDSIALIEAMRADDAHPTSPCNWEFNATPLWREMYS